MLKFKNSETITENIFREFYGANTFIEKTAIPKRYGFISKNNVNYSGLPDFFKDDNSDYSIIVEAKALEHSKAEQEIQFYMLNNNIQKDIIGIAISGQEISQIKVTYYYKSQDSNRVIVLQIRDTLISLIELDKKVKKYKSGDFISIESLMNVLKKINEKFHQIKIRDTDRSLFFSGIMIALTDNNFRNIYKYTQSPSDEEKSKTKAIISDSFYLNKLILSSISIQLDDKINSLSKEYSWLDRFSFIKTIDYPLDEYKNIIAQIEKNIYVPYTLDEKQDILGKAYKIFLKKAGKIDNKNIILTPDHIKGLMIKLARINIDDVIIDTCTGSGGFLMEAMEKLISLAKDNDDKIKYIKENQLVGFETDSILFALACSNMFLHGDGKTNLMYRSSLLEVGNKDDEKLFQFISELRPTKCIINPPYENNLPILFTIQAIKFLENNGKLIVIMPTPTLNKNQNKLTKELLQIAKLDFVIKMPFNLFSEQGRTVNTSIFGFTKTPHLKNDEVLFYNLRNDGFISVQHKGKVDKNNLWNDIENQVVDVVNNNKEIINISEKRKIYFDEENLNISGVKSKRNTNYKQMRISKIFNIQKGTLASTEGDNNGKYDFITASSEWQKHSIYSHDTEAIVYAIKAAGSLGRSHYVNGKFIASNLCVILTSKKDKIFPINMEFYKEYFETIKEQVVSDLADGTSKLTISEKSLGDYYIDYIPINTQEDYVNSCLLPYKDIFNKLQDCNKELLDNMKKIIK